MPVRFIQSSQHTYGVIPLKDLLVAEIRQPTTNEEPLILVEEQQANRTVHLYVIWESWAGISARERSEIVLDAYEEAKGGVEAARVTVSMGLTKAEAERLGLKY